VEQERFQTDPGCRFAVINNKVGAYSIDGLQYVANYLFVYESPVPVIDREQMERRLIRDGQANTVFIYDLVVQGTLDSRILDFHREGDDLLAALREDPRTVLNEAALLPQRA
jgi:SNF2 family DNA or RNA helicase